MNKEIQEAIMYLEHTTKDDFNLEKHQAENRIWAIKTLIEELQRKDNIINELKNYLEHKIEKWQDVSGVWSKAQVQEDKIILDKIQELENDRNI